MKKRYAADQDYISTSGHGRCLKMYLAFNARYLIDTLKLGMLLKEKLNLNKCNLIHFTYTTG